MGLAEYKKKRRFNKTPEPGPEKQTSEMGNIFVVQKHRATALHYDSRSSGWRCTSKITR